MNLNYFLPTLTLILVVAKLTGYIAWSWWLIFAPVYVSVLLAILLFAVFTYIASKR